LSTPNANDLVNAGSRAVLARATGRDHAACGVGLVARVSGEPDREVVELALGALAAMEHRGGVGADGEASDGAGILTAIPWRLLEPWLAEQRVAEPRPFSTAVGMVFLPREQGKRNLARELVAKALRDEGLMVVGWRPVPLRPEALPPSVRERHPHVEQVVAQSPVLAGDALERALLLARRAVGRALLRQPVIRRLDGPDEIGVLVLIPVAVVGDVIGREMAPAA
jgi:glutamate synthase (ferredoxin)